MVASNGVAFRKLIPAESAKAYAFAIFCVVVAAAIRWAFGLWFEGVVPFATFFPAVLLAALVGGLGPAILAALLGGIVAWWTFLPSATAPFLATAGTTASLITYFTTCLIVVWAGDHYRRLAKRLEDEQKFRELAVEELAHRLKNKVATIQAIVSIRLREHPLARDEIVSCLGSLKAADDLILAAQGRGALIGDILSAELRPYDVARLSMRGPEVLLPPKLAFTMALLFHELATNAAKYGALSNAAGMISVLWSVSDEWLKVEWRESDGPPVAIPKHRGFGTRLLSRALEQFDGKAEINFAVPGLACRLTVPIREQAADTIPLVSDAPAVVAADG